MPAMYSSAIGPFVNLSSLACAVTVPFNRTVNSGPLAVISYVFHLPPASTMASGLAMWTMAPVRPNGRDACEYVGLVAGLVGDLLCVLTAHVNAAIGAFVNPEFDAQLEIRVGFFGDQEPRAAGRLYHAAAELPVRVADGVEVVEIGAVEQCRPVGRRLLGRGRPERRRPIETQMNSARLIEAPPLAGVLSVQ